MFTGIITDVGTIQRIDQRGDVRIRIGTSYDMADVALGASIACSGACLTVVDKGSDWFDVDLSFETIKRTAPGLWYEGGLLNLERALSVGDELGGHIVTGHVDGVGLLVAAVPEGESVRITLRAPQDLARFLAPKGSVTLDGVSLTVNSVEDEPEGPLIGLNIIPHTQAHTSFGDLRPGRTFNIEIDILARYLGRMEQLRQ
ncbi:riboflavin synthase [Sphingomonadales bacterium 56]|uniref:Riboflavin synthase n=1 Tax=Sphingobium indicum TaxID=332055 RepID=A0A4V1W8N9_9SPHN|nr:MULTISPECIES: riboflavin synthase [Sphingobium]MBY2930694.1 riboflavin synthase [Sphingomonadales bacterium 56]MBY2960764.1 riboflavin synthase [Sphingomonadales bacterium 58]NYI24998.1 riboflavin synthase [Sphingobium indicum]RYL96726.1 riboflavin synthase [Sphingobium indicum]CAD7341773.1 Riboflavin synthase [Sphingobium sp. S6]